MSVARFLDSLFSRRSKAYGGCKLLSEVAQGGMSRIWQAKHLETGRVCAVKILTPESAEVMDTFKKAFEADEGAIALRLDHPNVIRTFDYGRGRGREYYIVMEYVDGPTLETMIIVEYPRVAKQRFDLLLQMSAGLHYIHQQGLIHRDFCPKNVLYGREGAIKIIDFGLTIPAGLKIRAAAARAGTASYMAPEQIRSQPVDVRADIYAFGLSAFEVLTGKRPFPMASDRGQRMRDHLNVEPLRLRQAAPELPLQLERVIHKCIAKDRDLRYKSMAEVIEEVKAALDIASL